MTTTWFRRMNSIRPALTTRTLVLSSAKMAVALLYSSLLLTAFVSGEQPIDLLTTPVGIQVPLNAVRAVLPPSRQDDPLRHVYSVDADGNIVGPDSFRIDFTQNAVRSAVLPHHPRLQLTLNGQPINQAQVNSTLKTHGDYHAVYGGERNYLLAVWGPRLHLLPIHQGRYPSVLVNTYHQNEVSRSVSINAELPDDDNDSVPGQPYFRYPASASDTTADCASGSIHFVELLAVTDNSFCALFGNDLYSLLTVLQASVNIATQPYLATCARPVLIGVEAHCNDLKNPFSYRGRTGGFIVEQLLQEFTTSPRDIRRDVAVLFTGYGATDAIGTAFLPGTCDRLGYAWVEKVNPFTLAHELGHNLNMYHTNEEGSHPSGIAGLMGTGGVSRQQWFFMPESIANLTQYLDHQIAGYDVSCISTQRPTCDDGCPTRCVDNKCVANTAPGSGRVSCAPASHFDCSDSVSIKDLPGHMYTVKVNCPTGYNFAEAIYDADDPALVCCLPTDDTQTVMAINTQFTYITPSTSRDDGTVYENIITVASNYTLESTTFLKTEMVACIGEIPGATPTSSPSSSVSSSPSPSTSVLDSPSPSTSATMSASASTSSSISIAPSISISASVTATASASPSVSVEASGSVSVSVTTSTSASPSVFVKASGPPIALSSVTASVSPSISRSNEPSTSISISPSPSVSASAEVTISSSSSASASLSPGPSISMSVSPSSPASLVVEASPSNSSSITPTSTASATTSIEPSVSISVSSSPAPSLSGMASLSASASISFSAASTESETPSVSATVSTNTLPTVNVSTSVSAMPSLVTSMTPSISISINAMASMTMSASPSLSKAPLSLSVSASYKPPPNLSQLTPSSPSSSASVVPSQAPSTIALASPAPSTSFIPDKNEPSPTTTSTGTTTATPSSSVSISPTPVSISVAIIPVTTVSTTVTPSFSISPTSLESSFPTITQSASLSSFSSTVSPSSSSSSSTSLTPSVLVLTSASLEPKIDPKFVSGLSGSSISVSPSLWPSSSTYNSQIPSASPTVSVTETAVTPSQSYKAPDTCGDTFTFDRHLACRKSADLYLYLNETRVLRLRIFNRYGQFYYVVRGLRGRKLRGFAMIVSTSRRLRFWRIRRAMTRYPSINKFTGFYDTPISDIRLTNGKTRCCGTKALYSYLGIRVCNWSGAKCERLETRIEMKMACRPVCAKNARLFLSKPMSIRRKCPGCEAVTNLRL